MKKSEFITLLIVTFALSSCGAFKKATPQGGANVEAREEIENGRSGVLPEVMEAKPDFALEADDDGSVKIVFYGFDFDMGSRTIVSDKKAYYVESPALVNFYLQRQIDGIMYSIYKVENGLVAVPQ